jgi:hypothetical protein
MERMALSARDLKAKLNRSLENCVKAKEAWEVYELRVEDAVAIRLGSSVRVEDPSLEGPREEARDSVAPETDEWGISEEERERRENALWTLDRSKHEGRYAQERVRHLERIEVMARNRDAILEETERAFEGWAGGELKEALDAAMKGTGRWEVDRPFGYWGCWVTYDALRARREAVLLERAEEESRAWSSGGLKGGSGIPSLEALGKESRAGFWGVMRLRARMEVETPRGVRDVGAAALATGNGCEPDGGERARGFIQPKEGFYYLLTHVAVWVDTTANSRLEDARSSGDVDPFATPISVYFLGEGMLPTSPREVEVALGDVSSMTAHVERSVGWIEATYLRMAVKPLQAWREGLFKLVEHLKGAIRELVEMRDDLESSPSGELAVLAKGKSLLCALAADGLEEVRERLRSVEVEFPLADSKVAASLPVTEVVEHLVGEVRKFCSSGRAGREALEKIRVVAQAVVGAFEESLEGLLDGSPEEGTPRRSGLGDSLADLRERRTALAEARSTDATAGWYFDAVDRAVETLEWTQKLAARVCELVDDDVSDSERWYLSAYAAGIKAMEGCATKAVGGPGGQPGDLSPLETEIWRLLELLEGWEARKRPEEARGLGQLRQTERLASHRRDANKTAFERNLALSKRLSMAPAIPGAEGTKDDASLGGDEAEEGRVPTKAELAEESFLKEVEKAFVRRFSSRPPPPKEVAPLDEKNAAEDDDDDEESEEAEDEIPWPRRFPEPAWVFGGLPDGPLRVGLVTEIARLKKLAIKHQTAVRRFLAFNRRVYAFFLELRAPRTKTATTTTVETAEERRPSALRRLAELEDEFRSPAYGADRQALVLEIERRCRFAAAAVRSLKAAIRPFPEDGGRGETSLEAREGPSREATRDAYEIFEREAFGKEEGEGSDLGERVMEALFSGWIQSAAGEAENRNEAISLAASAAAFYGTYHLTAVRPAERVASSLREDALRRLDLAAKWLNSTAKGQEAPWDLERRMDDEEESFFSADAAEGHAKNWPPKGWTEDLLARLRRSLPGEDYKRKIDWNFKCAIERFRKPNAAIARPPVACPGAPGMAFGLTAEEADDLVARFGDGDLRAGERSPWERDAEERALAWVEEYHRATGSDSGRARRHVLPAGYLLYALLCAETEALGEWALREDRHSNGRPYPGDLSEEGNVARMRAVTFKMFYKKWAWIRYLASLLNGAVVHDSARPTSTRYDLAARSGGVSMSEFKLDVVSVNETGAAALDVTPSFYLPEHVADERGRVRLDEYLEGIPKATDLPPPGVALSAEYGHGNDELARASSVRLAYRPYTHYGSYRERAEGEAIAGGYAGWYAEKAREIDEALEGLDGWLRRLREWKAEVEAGRLVPAPGALQENEANTKNAIRSFDEWLEMWRLHAMRARDRLYGDGVTLRVKSALYGEAKARAVDGKGGNYSWCVTVLSALQKRMADHQSNVAKAMLEALSRCRGAVKAEWQAYETVLEQGHTACIAFEKKKGGNAALPAPPKGPEPEPPSLVVADDDADVIDGVSSTVSRVKFVEELLSPPRGAAFAGPDAGSSWLRDFLVRRLAIRVAEALERVLVSHLQATRESRSHVEEDGEDRRRWTADEYDLYLASGYDEAVKVASSSDLVGGPLEGLARTLSKWCDAASSVGGSPRTPLGRRGAAEELLSVLVPGSVLGEALWKLRRGDDVAGDAETLRMGDLATSAANAADALFDRLSGRGGGGGGGGGGGALLTLYRNQFSGEAALRRGLATATDARAALSEPNAESEARFAACLKRARSAQFGLDVVLISGLYGIPGDLTEAEQIERLNYHSWGNFYHSERHSRSKRFYDLYQKTSECFVLVTVDETTEEERADVAHLGTVRFCAWPEAALSAALAEARSGALRWEVGDLSPLGLPCYAATYRCTVDATSPFRSRRYDLLEYTHNVDLPPGAGVPIHYDLRYAKGSLTFEGGGLDGFDVAYPDYGASASDSISNLLEGTHSTMPGHLGGLLVSVAALHFAEGCRVGLRGSSVRCSVGRSRFAGSRPWESARGERELFRMPPFRGILSGNPEEAAADAGYCVAHLSRCKRPEPTRNWLAYLVLCGMVDLEPEDADGFGDPATLLREAGRVLREKGAAPDLLRGGVYDSRSGPLADRARGLMMLSVAMEDHVWKKRPLPALDGLVTRLRKMLEPDDPTSPFYDTHAVECAFLESFISKTHADAGFASSPDSRGGRDEHRYLAPKVESCAQDAVFSHLSRAACFASSEVVDWYVGGIYVLPKVVQMTWPSSGRWTDSKFLKIAGYATLYDVLETSVSRDREGPPPHSAELALWGRMEDAFRALHRITPKPFDEYRSQIQWDAEIAEDAAEEEEEKEKEKKGQREKKEEEEGRRKEAEVDGDAEEDGEGDEDASRRRVLEAQDGTVANEDGEPADDGSVPGGPRTKPVLWGPSPFEVPRGSDLVAMTSTLLGAFRANPKEAVKLGKLPQALEYFGRLEKLRDKDPRKYWRMRPLKAKWAWIVSPIAAAIKRAEGLPPPPQPSERRAKKATAEREDLAGLDLDLSGVAIYDCLVGWLDSRTERLGALRREGPARLQRLDVDLKRLEAERGKYLRKAGGKPPKGELEKELRRLAGKIEEVAKKRAALKKAVDASGDLVTLNDVTRRAELRRNAKNLETLWKYVTSSTSLGAGDETTDPSSGEAAARALYSAPFKLHAIPSVKAVRTIAGLLESYRGFLMERQKEAREAEELGRVLRRVTGDPGEVYDAFCSGLDLIFVRPATAQFGYHYLYAKNANFKLKAALLNVWSDSAYGERFDNFGATETERLGTEYPCQGYRKRRRGAGGGGRGEELVRFESLRIGKQKVGNYSFASFLGWEEYANNVDSELAGFGRMPRLEGGEEPSPSTGNFDPEENPARAHSEPLKYVRRLQDDLLSLVVKLYLREGPAASAEDVAEEIEDPKGFFVYNYLLFRESVRKYVDGAPSLRLGIDDVFDGCFVDAGGRSPALQPLEWMYVMVWRTFCPAATSGDGPLESRVTRDPSDLDISLPSDYIRAPEGRKAGETGSFTIPHAMHHLRTLLLGERRESEGEKSKGKDEDKGKGRGRGKGKGKGKGRGGGGGGSGNEGKDESRGKGRKTAETARKTNRTARDSKAAWNLVALAAATAGLVRWMVFDYYKHASQLARHSVDVVPTKPFVGKVDALVASAYPAEDAEGRERLLDREGLDDAPDRFTLEGLFGITDTTQAPRAVGSGDLYAEIFERDARKKAEGNRGEMKKGTLSAAAAMRQMYQEALGVRYLASKHRARGTYTDQMRSLVEVVEASRLYAHYLSHSHKNRESLNTSASIAKLQRPDPGLAIAISGGGSQQERESVAPYPVGSYNVDRVYGPSRSRLHYTLRSDVSTISSPDDLQKTHVTADAVTSSRLFGRPHVQRKPALKPRRNFGRTATEERGEEEGEVGAEEDGGGSSGVGATKVATFAATADPVPSPSPAGTSGGAYEVDSVTYYSKLKLRYVDLSEVEWREHLASAQIEEDAPRPFRMKLSNSDVDGVAVLSAYAPARLLGMSGSGSRVRVHYVEARSSSPLLRSSPYAFAAFWSDVSFWTGSSEVQRGPCAKRVMFEGPWKDVLKPNPEVIAAYGELERRLKGAAEVERAERADGKAFRSEPRKEARDAAAFLQAFLLDSARGEERTTATDGGGSPYSLDRDGNLMTKREEPVLRLLAGLHALWCASKVNHLSGVFLGRYAKVTVPLALECRSRCLPNLAPYNISPVTVAEKGATRGGPGEGLRYYDSAEVPAPACEPHHTAIDVMHVIVALVRMASATCGSALRPISADSGGSRISMRKAAKLATLTNLSSSLYARYVLNQVWCNMLSRTEEAGEVPGVALILREYVTSPQEGKRVFFDVRIVLPRNYVNDDLVPVGALRMERVRSSFGRRSAMPVARYVAANSTLGRSLVGGYVQPKRRDRTPSSKTKAKAGRAICGVFSAPVAVDSGALPRVRTHLEFTVEGAPVRHGKSDDLEEETGRSKRTKENTGDFMGANVKVPFLVTQRSQAGPPPKPVPKSKPGPAETERKKRKKEPEGNPTDGIPSDQKRRRTEKKEVFRAPPSEPSGAAQTPAQTQTSIELDVEGSTEPVPATDASAAKGAPTAERREKKRLNLSKRGGRYKAKRPPTVDFDRDLEALKTPSEGTGEPTAIDRGEAKRERREALEEPGDEAEGALPSAKRRRGAVPKKAVADSPVITRFSFPVAPGVKPPEGVPRSSVSVSLPRGSPIPKARDPGSGRGWTVVRRTRGTTSRRPDGETEGEEKKAKGEPDEGKGESGATKRRPGEQKGRDGTGSGSGSGTSDEKAIELDPIRLRDLIDLFGYDPKRSNPHLESLRSTGRGFRLLPSKEGEIPSRPYASLASMSDRQRECLYYSYRQNEGRLWSSSTIYRLIRRGDPLLNHLDALTEPAERPDGSRGLFVKRVDVQNVLRFMRDAKNRSSFYLEEGTVVATYGGEISMVGGKGTGTEKEPWKVWRDDLASQQVPAGTRGPDFKIALLGRSPSGRSLDGQMRDRGHYVAKSAGDGEPNCQWVFVPLEGTRSKLEEPSGNRGSEREPDPEDYEPLYCGLLVFLVTVARVRPGEELTARYVGSFLS